MTKEIVAAGPYRSVELTKNDGDHIKQILKLLYAAPHSAFSIMESCVEFKSGSIAIRLFRYADRPLEIQSANFWQEIKIGWRQRRKVRKLARLILDRASDRKNNELLSKVVMELSGAQGGR